jgi:uncharacterized protein (DUF433 family)
MTPALVLHLRRLCADGTPVKAIVLDYPQFSESAIRNALAGRTYKNVNADEVSWEK